MQLLISGLAMGSIYAMIALGFTLLWNACGLINFAQGEFAMLGMFFALTFYAFWGWPAALSIILSLLLVSLVGIILERLAIRRVYGRELTVIVIITVGLQIFLSNSARFVWGSHPFRFPHIFGTAKITSFNISVETVLMFALAMVSIAVLQFLLKKTNLGLAMRALSQDQETAMLMGINVPMMLSLAFGLSSFLGAFAGILMAPQLFVAADIGLPLIIKAFVAAVIGGFGSYPGALLGGLIIGVLDNMSSFYISTAYRDVITFSALILILVFKPSGLFGKAKEGW
ncbi:MAG: branched-chain amino acid ABC transporter permease [Dethiobacteria bacterium]